MTIKPQVTQMGSPMSSQTNLSGDGPADFTAQWTEARYVYPLYAALAEQFHFAEIPHPAGELPPA